MEHFMASHFFFLRCSNQINYLITPPHFYSHYIQGIILCLYYYSLAFYSRFLLQFSIAFIIIIVAVITNTTIIIIKIINFRFSFRFRDSLKRWIFMNWQSKPRKNFG